MVPTHSHNYSFKIRILLDSTSDCILKVFYELVGLNVVLLLRFSSQKSASHQLLYLLNFSTIQCDLTSRDFNLGLVATFSSRFGLKGNRMLVDHKRPKCELLQMFYQIFCRRLLRKGNRINSKSSRGLRLVGVKA